MSYKLPQHRIDKMSEYGIPERMHGGLIRYYNDRIEPGHFLTAVLENDLVGAFGAADEGNKKAMNAYVLWLYNQAPMGSYGSKEAVQRWLEGGHELQKEDAA